VAERVARGQVNDVPSAPTRTIGQIVRSNLVTRFNRANTAVGIVQELRAKRTLDRLEVVNAPRARVVREGRVAELAVGQVVLDDVLEAAAGDQVVVDGEVLDGAGLEVDESLLTWSPRGWCCCAASPLPSGWSAWGGARCWSGSCRRSRPWPGWT
jgi:cation-transporting ATPase E